LDDWAFPHWVSLKPSPSINSVVRIIRYALLKKAVQHQAILPPFYLQGVYSIANMKMNRPDNLVLDIAVFLALSILIISATLATIIQMQKDMLAAESVTQLSSSYKSQAPAPSIRVTWSKR
jgi:hypothetical protein